MRVTKLLPAFLAIAAALVASGCEDAGKLTAPQIRGSAVSVPSPEFMAALKTEIESEHDAPTKPTDVRSAASWGGIAQITGPTVIERPGCYRVTSDFIASGDGIVVRSDWVWLDLRHHIITGPGNKSGRGILLDNVKQVLVTGGTLEMFGTGVALEKSSGSCVRGLRVKGGDEFADPANGIPPQVGILLVNSYQNKIRGNGLDDTNLGIFVRGGGSFENRVRRNEVVGGDNGLLGICYNPAMDEGPAGPRLDTVTENFLCRFGGGIQASAQSANNRFRFNTIRYFGFASKDFNGTNEFKNNDTIQITSSDGCNRHEGGEND